MVTQGRSFLPSNSGLAAGDMSRPRQLLACGAFAALLWALSVVLLRQAPPAVEVPQSDPVAFARYVGSVPVRLATVLAFLSHLLQLVAGFGVVAALGAGPGSRRAFWGALLAALGHFVAAANSGVALLVYPRVASLVEEGRLEAVDVVGVLPMAAIAAQILPIVVGVLLQAVAVADSRSLPRASGGLVACGSVGSLLALRTPIAWLLILGLWLGGAVWLWMGAGGDPVSEEVSLDFAEDRARPTAERATSEQEEDDEE